MFDDTIKKLAEQIEVALVPEISGKQCILLDVPFYTNIGDTLIWEGTRQVLHKNKVKCIGEFPNELYDFRPLSKDIVILLQGGGNFGDIWPQFQKFRNKVVERYPQNEIIILPQTVFFYDHETMRLDAEAFARHDNLIICARDRVSYETLKKNYKNRIWLLPDMAFCIDANWLRGMVVPSGDRELFFRRVDKEININYDYYQIVPREADVHDWPSLEFCQPFIPNRLIRGVVNRMPSYLRRIFNVWYGVNVYRARQIRQGVEFLSGYKHVYTTRLHAAILSVLLCRSFTFFDNNYGKNSAFYDTWLSDLAGIKFVRTNS